MVTIKIMRGGMAVVLTGPTREDVYAQLRDWCPGGRLIEIFWCMGGVQ